MQSEHKMFKKPTKDRLYTIRFGKEEEKE